MAKIIVTFNEIRASAELAKVVADAIAAHTGTSVPLPEKFLQDLDDSELAEYLRQNNKGVDTRFYNVGFSDVTVEVPEKFVVGYCRAYGKLVERVVPLGIQIFNIGKSVFGLFKVFQKDILCLAKDVFGTKPDFKE